MIETLRSLVIVAAAMMALAACSNPFGGSSSTVDPNHHPGVSGGTTVAPSQGTDFTSSSLQSVSTVNGRFTLSATLGDSSSEIESVTPRGYRLFSTVQGQIISNGQGL